jgi:hypothetical protein
MKVSERFYHLKDRHTSVESEEYYLHPSSSRNEEVKARCGESKLKTNLKGSN